VHCCLSLITSGCVGAGTSSNISCRHTHNATLTVMVSVVQATVKKQSCQPRLRIKVCRPKCQLGSAETARNSNHAKFCSQYSQVPSHTTNSITVGRIIKATCFDTSFHTKQFTVYKLNTFIRPALCTSKNARHTTGDIYLAYWYKVYRTIFIYMGPCIVNRI